MSNETPPVVGTPFGELQSVDAQGMFIPKPVYVLVPCKRCFAQAARSGPDAYDPDCEGCGGTDYVRRDPEQHPIAPRQGAQEKPAS